MDMSADTTNIAARRVEMERTKPITQKPRTPVEERLTAHSTAETDDDVSRRKPAEDSTEKRKSAPHHQGFYDTDARSEDEETEPQRLSSNDGEEHILDAMA